MGSGGIRIGLPDSVFHVVKVKKAIHDIPPGKIYAFPHIGEMLFIQPTALIDRLIVRKIHILTGEKHVDIHIAAFHCLKIRHQISVPIF